MTPLPTQAGGPRIAPFARLRTKPQTPYTREGRSASLSYRPPLADAAFCNLLALARSCRGVSPLTPLTSPSIKFGPPLTLDTTDVSISPLSPFILLTCTRGLERKSP